jgi:hypothetical protein
MSETPPNYLVAALSDYTEIGTPDSRPFVTLTFAQSLDAKIAGKDGKQLILSGRESMIMTHWLVISCFFPDHQALTLLLKVKDHARRDLNWDRYCIKR